MEIESKSILADHHEHARLVRALSPPLRRLDQINHYFDASEHTWARRDAAVRLRWENGRPELSVKTAGTARADFMERGEYEWELETAEAELLQEGGAILTSRVFHGLEIAAPELARQLDALRQEPLRRVGTMRTHRQVFPLGVPGAADLEVEVDETTYPDGSVRWEVELEIGEDDDGERALAALRNRLRDEGIPWRPSRTSKRERLQRILES